MKTMFWKWLRVSLEMIFSMLIMATGATLWLLMAIPDPISILIGFIGLGLFYISATDLEKCEIIARKRAEKTAQIKEEMIRQKRSN